MEELRNLARILDVAVDADGYRLHPRRSRKALIGEHGTGGAQEHASAALNVSCAAEMLRIDEAVIGGVRLSEHAEAGGVAANTPVDDKGGFMVVLSPTILVRSRRFASAHRKRRMGVATVLSTISGTPCSCATSANASMSQMLPAGLPTLSQKTALAFSSICASILAG